MPETVLSALITGVLALLGVILTNNAASRRLAAENKASQAVIEAHIEELTREVRMHNDFARRIPVLEERIDTLKQRVDALQ